MLGAAKEEPSLRSNLVVLMSLMNQDETVIRQSRCRYIRQRHPSQHIL